MGIKNTVKQKPAVKDGLNDHFLFYSTESFTQKDRMKFCEKERKCLDASSTQFKEWMK